jgi:hypothetical protein
MGARHMKESTKYIGKSTLMYLVLTRIVAALMGTLAKSCHQQHTLRYHQHRSPLDDMLLNIALCESIIPFYVGFSKTYNPNLKFH